MSPVSVFEPRKRWFRDALCRALLFRKAPGSNHSQLSGRVGAIHVQQPSPNFGWPFLEVRIGASDSLTWGPRYLRIKAYMIEYEYTGT